MLKYSWSVEKNDQLRADSDRRVCFEDIVAAIESGGLLDDIEHPNKIKYPLQRIFVVQLSGYAYAVPYVRSRDGSCFLKTAYPSRDLNRLYLMGGVDEK
jgi:hypothetical protein